MNFRLIAAILVLLAVVGVGIALIAYVIEADSSQGGVSIDRPSDGVFEPSDALPVEKTQPHGAHDENPPEGG